MAISSYQCDARKFALERAGEVENCPDCGENKVRLTTEAEQTEYARIKLELATEQDGKL